MSSGLHAGTFVNDHHANRYEKQKNRYMPVGDGSQVVPIYTQQGHLDPEVANVPYGTDRRNMMLNRRRRQQRKAENTAIIQDRPMN
tara:strand:+ start:93 stop:350 length:258 start_codon:yes stop_codon:yes gene_type:complete